METYAYIVEDRKVDGKKLHEVMYQNGVNNIATRNAIKKRLGDTTILDNIIPLRAGLKRTVSAGLRAPELSIPYLEEQ